MNNDLRPSLEAKRSEEIKNAARQLLEDPKKDITECFQLVEAYSKLLSLMNPPRSHERLWALSVGILCIFLAGLLMLPLRRTYLTLNIKSESTDLMLAKSFSWESEQPQNINIFRISGLMNLDAPALGLDIKSKGNNGWIQINKGNALLTQFNLGEGGLLAFNQTSGGSFDAYVKGADLRGKLEVAGSEVAISAGEETDGSKLCCKEPIVAEIPEIIDFRAGSGIATPSQFKLRTGTNFTMKNLKVKNIAFTKEIHEEPGNVSAISTIAEGKLILHDANNETLSLNKGDRLQLEGVEGRVVNLQTGKEIELTFEGSVKKVRIGPKGFEQDHTPSYLEYLYYNQRLALLWSAVIFLWGILWSIRKTIFS